VRSPFAGLLDRLLGRGDAAVTVPPMDGALKPNHLIDVAPVGIEIPNVDNLVQCRDRRLLSSGASILVLSADGRATTPFESGATERGEILAMAGTQSGSLAVARDGSGITVVAGPHQGRQIADLGGAPLRCCTCLHFVEDDRLVVCEGSRTNGPEQWQRDLLDNGSSGSVWLVDLKGSATPAKLAAGLAFPYGVAQASADEIVVAESWNSRLLRLRLDGKAASTAVLSGIPGYPSRMTPAANGHTWMTVFAPRSQLIELVRREKRFRRAMMAEVDPRYWVSASLSSGSSFREPMQGGALKQMGILKPWAPTRSYGLVVLLDPKFQPVASFHSRTGGRRHGITSALEIDDRTLLVASKGAGEVFALDSATRAA
jgi:hypothetical protein